MLSARNFCARGAPNFFRKFRNFFLAIFAHNVRDLDVRFFGSARTMDPVESYNDVMRFVKLMLAEKNEFCAHGATKFRKFCNSFAKFLAIFCANFAIMISTSDAKFFSPEQIYESDESFSDVTRFVQRKLAKCTCGIGY